MAIEAWEGFWRQAQEASAHRAGGAHEHLLHDFWTGFFRECLSSRRNLRFLDMACGNGAVFEYLAGSVGRAGEAKPTMLAVCMDGSGAALEDLRRRRPEVSVVIADVRQAPFAPGGFDLVTSQFGVEYGGPDTPLEAARLVGDGGMLALVLHLKHGGIYRECANNLQAIEAMYHLLPMARETLDAGIATSHGAGAKAVFLTADRNFARGVAEVEAVFRQFGKEVATGLIFRLYADIGHIYKNMGRYSQDEVTRWLGRMGEELDSYRERMAGMVESALDGGQLKELERKLERAGLCLRQSQALSLGSLGDAAWTMVAVR
jgi:ubiquinone/menaquinone biosynthesis C-methylase UbiE